MQSKAPSRMSSKDDTSSSSSLYSEGTSANTDSTNVPTGILSVPRGKSSSSTIELSSHKKEYQELHKVENDIASSSTRNNESSESQQELTTISTPTRKKKVQVFSPPLPTIPSISTMNDHGETNDQSSQNGKAEEINGEAKTVKRKRRRIIPQAQALRQMVSIEPNTPGADIAISKKLLRLPIDQYECTLQRRAVRKRETLQHFTSIPQPKSMLQKENIPRISLLPSSDGDETKSLERHGIKVSASNSIVEKSDEEHLEIEGDTSLGMKLTILSGKVIVQKLMPLRDGRASPAQLTGMVSRGDVLLSIDDRPLISLGNLDILIQRLKPLSTPDDNGEYKRNVRVRFAVGEGLTLLHKDDGNEKKRKKQEERKRFQVAQYTMVDQLSGAPLFHNHESIPSADDDESDIADQQAIVVGSQMMQRKAKTMPLQEAISIQVAMDHQARRSMTASAYFAMNDEISPLLRMREEIISNDESQEDVAKKQEELLEKGKQALVNARRLYNEVEIGPLRRLMDPLNVVRSECRSFSSRSRFSQKYTRPNDSDDDSSSDEESGIDSMVSGEVGDGEIGDEMLLRLAVWNRTWKRRMVETLEAASVHTRDKRKDAEMKKVKEKKNKGDNLEVQLQNLFFGSQVTEMMNKKKTTVALPPDEVTEVLFDLATRVTATIPTNINVISGLDLSFDDLIENKATSSRGQHTKADREVEEGTRFLLEDILPAWMDTFKPIPLKQRRVIWPLVKDESSVTATPDDLSMESAATGWSAGTPERRSRLEDRIAHLELDADTRIETCMLVTFYFTRKIIPNITALKEVQLYQRSDIDGRREKAENDAIEFIQSFGSYLDLFESLLSASESLSKAVVHSLLSIAKNDPTHIDCTKQFTRNISIVPYEPKLLSSLLLRLDEIVSNPTASIPENLLPLIVAAYPDLKPWQMRTSLPSYKHNPGEIICDTALKDMDTKDAILYYVYLSLLMESSQMARMDEVLVKEWCVMSISTEFKSENSSRRENFMKVALIEDAEQSPYYRDLSYLIDASISIEDISLTLELSSEIISKAKKQSDCELLMKTVRHLMSIATNSINEGMPSQFDSTLLKKVLVLLHDLEASKHKVCRESINVPEELLKLLNASTAKQQHEEDITMLMSNVCSPRSYLKSIFAWESSEHVPMLTMVSMLRTSLVRGLEVSIDGSDADEISFALLRIREIHQKGMKDQSNSELHQLRSGLSIWEQMEQGSAIINK